MNAGLDVAWSEAVILAQRLLRDVLDGRTPDPVSVGALAERVLAVAATDADSGAGNEEEDAHG